MPAFCLMLNHAHLALPVRAEALAVALEATHGLYPAYWNTHSKVRRDGGFIL